MKRNLKYILIFIVVLLIYFIPGFIFRAKPEYYESLTKPSYAPKAWIFGVAWPILFVLFSILISKKIVQNSLRLDQTLLFLINYFITFFFNKIFFIDKNLLFTLIDTLLCFVSGVLLAVSIYKENKAESLILLPYILWTAFASVLMTQIYYIYR